MLALAVPHPLPGGYANVYRADDAVTGTSYVLKRMTVFKDNLLVAGCARCVGRGQLMGLGAPSPTADGCLPDVGRASLMAHPPPRCGTRPLPRQQ